MPKDRIGLIRLKQIVWELLSVLSGAGSGTDQVIKLRHELADDLGYLDAADERLKKEGSGG